LPRTKRQLLQLSQQHQLPSDIEGDEGQDEYEDQDLHRGFNRPRLDKTEFDDDDEELSDYVKIRLLVARMKALQKYNEKWG
jgi:hypothetical protein